MTRLKKGAIMSTAAQLPHEVVQGERNQGGENRDDIPHLDGQRHKPRFVVNIEGKDYPWDHETITVPEIRSLGSIPPDMPVLEINLEDNTEHTLRETRSSTSSLVTASPKRSASSGGESR